MLFRLFILFTIIPLIELSILIKIGAYIGTWNTIVLVVTTGMLGAALARHQGIKTFTSIQQALHAGQLPGDRLIDALLILIAGALLITPGILTDVSGFLLLIGSTRGELRRYLKNRFQAHLVLGRCPPVDYRRDDDFIDVEATASDTENPPDQE